ncbi:MAG: V-type ATP synthase subunit E family protein [Candidatus Omnitrophica bacterium]|nr:V-type ATP synthase subunit E family protein [Candidatus Omnitrophota bacterium]
MTDQIKELIEKINQEGSRAAEENARRIEQEARDKAGIILQKAESQAKKMTEEARDRIDSLQASSQAALKQAGRDLLLSLKQEIFEMLERVMVAQASAALKPDALAAIISELIKEYCRGQDTGVQVYLKEQDRRVLEEDFLNKLKGELKRGIELRAQDDIQAGFVISFDSGKSHFDFTDKSLAQYLGTHVKPKLAEILKGEQSE